MKRIVLVAASRPTVLESLPTALKFAGLRVIVAKSGLDALHQARCIHPDVILLDAALPDMDGPTVADILARLPSTTGIQTVLLQLPTASHAEVLIEVANVLRLCPLHTNPAEMPTLAAQST